MTRWLFALTLCLWGAALARDRIDVWIDATAVPPLVLETSAEVRDRNGTLLRAYTVDDGRWRLALSPEAVDPLYLAMLKAYEDKRFDTHSGVDPRAMLRATWQSLRAGRIVSGGSTLTMQTARLLENSGTGAWAGKLRQVRLALALERRLSKAGVLRLYLHLAPMGGNLEGLRAATLSYFGKEPLRLTPAEAALLVALPQSPEARRPDRAPLAAVAARDRVLARMARDGVISDDTARAAQGDTGPRQRLPFPALAPHLSDRMMRDHPDAPRLTLTVDGDVQAKIEELAHVTMRGRSDRLSIAILVADHQSGEIIASVGSGGLDPRGQGFVDMTEARRSPGSTLKPLIYGLAFDAGLAHPETLIDDRPMRFDGYAPQNFDGVFRGELRVADALRLSLNLPAVQLTEALGPQNLMAALRRAGTRPEVPGAKPGLAIALGGLGLSLRELTQLYAGLANGGVAQPLHALSGSGTTPDVTPQRILSRAAAWQVGHILAGLAPPPGAPANRLSYKTGTSYGHRDAWAIGYDGAHVIGVWMGRPDGTPVPGGFGGDLAAPVLFEAFGRLKPSLERRAPPPPETLLIGASQLPEPLRHFRPRDGFALTPDQPVVAFPPDGAVLTAGAAIPAKVRDGQPPFTWLVNGRPVKTGQRNRDSLLSGVGRGFTELAVIDAAGQSARVEFLLE